MKHTILQFSKFGIIGVLNTAIDSAVFISLTRGIVFFREHYLLAALIAFVVSGVNGYYWSRRWTFKHHSGKTHEFSYQQMLKFYVATGVALLINQSVLWGLVEHFHILDIIAKPFSGMAAGVFSFALQKLWIFAFSEDPQDEEEIVL